MSETSRAIGPGVPARVSLVTLGVADVAAATAFYERLGWERSPASEESVSFFRTAGCVLALFGARDLAADAGRDPQEGERGQQRGQGEHGFRGVTLAVNVETPEAVEAALAAAVEAGATLAKPATRADWGGVSGYFADPDGHLWEVAWAPGFDLGPDGAIRLP